MESALGNPMGYMQYYRPPSPLQGGMGSYPTGMASISRGPSGGWSPAMSSPVGNFYGPAAPLHMAYGWPNAVNSAALTAGQMGAYAPYPFKGMQNGYVNGAGDMAWGLPLTMRYNPSSYSFAEGGNPFGAIPGGGVQGWGSGSAPMTRGYFQALPNAPYLTSSAANPFISALLQHLGGLRA